jgi:hypothetical protein
VSFTRKEFLHVRHWREGGASEGSREVLNVGLELWRAIVGRAKKFYYKAPAKQPPTRFTQAFHSPPSNVRGQHCRERTTTMTGELPTATRASQSTTGGVPNTHRLTLSSNGRRASPPSTVSNSFDATVVASMQPSDVGADGRVFSPGGQRSKDGA